MNPRPLQWRRGLALAVVVGLLAIALGACAPQAAAPTATSPAEEPAQPTATREPSAVPPTEISEPTAEPGLPALSAEPQRVEFQAEDGKALVGTYFPAASNPAPAVILMHWAGGDRRDWLALAPWLQNRSGELADFPDWQQAIGPDCGGQLEGPWLDPSWFPPMPESFSVAVFAFDFRDFCESGAGLNSPLDWTLDAKAAFATVAELPGVDPHRIAAIGASIGADGAPDGCLLHNQASETCVGALSLSPGDYLQMNYGQVVAELEASEPAVPVWCLAAELDAGSPETCQSAVGEHYQVHLYPGEAHGMMLIVPELEPNPLRLIQDFLGEVLGFAME